jgi:hypothetical protein
MHFYGDSFRANFFDLKNSIIRQNNGDLEPLKGFGINFFWSNHPLIYLNLSLKMIKQGGDTRNPKKTFFIFLAEVSKTFGAVAVATAFRVLY